MQPLYTEQFSSMLLLFIGLPGCISGGFCSVIDSKIVLNKCEVDGTLMVGQDPEFDWIWVVSISFNVSNQSFVFHLYF